MAFLFRNSDKKSQHTGQEEKRHFLEHDSNMIIPSVAGKLQQLIRLPPLTDIHEWLATNSLAFFTQINIQVGVVSQLCTQSTCAQMSAGSQVFELDIEKKKKVKMHAKQYIDTVMMNIQKQLGDEQTFPTKFGYEFPFDFVQIVRKLFRQYFIILAHIYFHHYHQFKRLQLHDGLNTLFLHFVYFVTEFSLIDPKELSLLDDLIEKLKTQEQALAKQPLNDRESEFNMVASKSS
ncbi:PREDICTED: MOB kinase activator 2-like [Amphimedon queenslandica]|uniref:Uncharacterized protein n=1 Tax=Amphimedon queenslandica TaxID=400682 RepID=A0A1X7V5D9_AMPQE|nr:PREDICTED: MOB kinase activator 2-like [Amphimedon queenslandica]|eukprot:XP_003385641.1 PREDICTED: MOB kinase activator 2-like [Amphimedon queenslandica]